MDINNILDLIDKLQNFRLSSLEEVKFMNTRIFSSNLLESYIIKQHLINLIQYENNFDLIEDIIYELIKELNHNLDNCFLIGIAHILDILSNTIKICKIPYVIIINILQYSVVLIAKIFENRQSDNKFTSLFSVIKLCSRSVKYLNNLLSTQFNKININSIYSHYYEISKAFIRIINSNCYPSFIVNKVLDFLILLLNLKSPDYNFKVSVLILNSLCDDLSETIFNYKTIKIRNNNFKLTKSFIKKYKKIYSLNKRRFSYTNKNRIRSHILNYYNWPLKFLLASSNLKIFSGEQNLSTSDLKIFSNTKILLNKISIQKYILLLLNVSYIALLNSNKDKEKVTNTLLSLDKFLRIIKCNLQHEIIVNISTKYESQSCFNPVILIFTNQDDCLIQILLLILRIQNWIPENSIFNSNMLFVEFLQFLNFDWSILLDFLSSPETHFLTYFLLQLKYINSNPKAFKSLFDNLYENNLNHGKVSKLYKDWKNKPIYKLAFNSNKNRPNLNLYTNINSQSDIKNNIKGFQANETKTKLSFYNNEIVISEKESIVKFASDSEMDNLFDCNKFKIKPFVFNSNNNNMYEDKINKNCEANTSNINNDINIKYNQIDFKNKLCVMNCNELIKSDFKDIQMESNHKINQSSSLLNNHIFLERNASNVKNNSERSSSEIDEPSNQEIPNNHNLDNSCTVNAVVLYHGNDNFYLKRKYCFKSVQKCLEILKRKLEFNLRMEEPLIPYNVRPLIKQLALFNELIL